MFDAHGPTGLMIAGTLCCLISTMTTSVCKEYYQYILSQGILFGLGVGLLYVYFEIITFVGPYNPLLFLDFIHHFQAFQPISPNIALRQLGSLWRELVSVRDCGLFGKNNLTFFDFQEV